MRYIYWHIGIPGTNGSTLLPSGCAIFFVILGGKFVMAHKYYVTVDAFYGKSMHIARNHFQILVCGNNCSRPLNTMAYDEENDNGMIKCSNQNIVKHIMIMQSEPGTMEYESPLS